jgi:hypothetical protein
VTRRMPTRGRTYGSALIAGTGAALHLKPYPYYVSDATTADVIDCLRRLVNASGRAAEVGRRLWVAMGTDRLAIRTHPFYCAPLSY